jgi:dynein heavy chain 1
MTSQTIEELNGYLGTVLQNLRGITGIDYDTKRVHMLIEVICKDCTNQLLKILGQENLMFCSFSEFKVWHEKTNDVFKKLDDNINHFVTRARGGNYAGIIGLTQNQQRTNYQHIPLKNRLDQLYKIRDLHQNLKTVIEEIIARTSNKGFLSINDIESGYNSFKGINVLDLSKEGEETLARCEKEFNHCIDTAETYITKRLREKLGNATNANEMFRIFSKFSGLFFRPRIKSAIE